MINVLTLTLLLALPPQAGLQAHEEVPESLTCPVESARMRSNLMWFLTRPELAADRVKVGLAATDVRSVRPLSAAEDSNVCARLNEIMERGHFTASPFRRAYYAAGAFYFVTIVQEFVPGTSFRMGHTPTVIVLDRDLKPVYATSAGSGAR